MKTVVLLIIALAISSLTTGCASMQSKSSGQMAYIDMATGFKQAFDEEILGISDQGKLEQHGSAKVNSK